MQITAKQKSIFYLIISFISFVFLIISLTVHLIAFWNINLTDQYPYVFLLHLGIFVLIAPILLIQKIEEKQEDEKLITLNEGFNEVKKSEKVSDKKSDIPKWLIVVYVLISFYGFINFLIFGLGAKGNAEIVDGKYVLRERGRVVREISKDEYDAVSAQSLRGFSGHWIIFYFYFKSVAFVQYKNQKEK